MLGCRLNYSNQSHALFLLHEIFVNASYAFTHQSASPRIIDCGANIGFSIAFFKFFCPQAFIIAFEPEPQTFSHLAQNISQNGWHDVQLHQAAVSDHDGTLLLYSNPTDADSILASVDPAWGGGRPQTVPSIRLSSLIRQPVDFLKMDIEGAEYVVLQDLLSSGTLDQVQETIIEYHPTPNASQVRENLVAQMQMAGWQVTRRADSISSPTGLLHAIKISPSARS
jgi:FkbM family methyltransferase